MIKPDKWIVKMAREFKMIEPFEENQVRKGCISYGVSCYGYDMRVANEFKIYNDKGIIDPKKLDTSLFKEIKADDFIVIDPNSYILARSVEYFRIPRNILTICFGKSTYARCGIIVNVTPFEPEWEGFVTMSISNPSNCPVKLYANEGIAQVLFLESNEVCQTSYADKKGKYQAQKEITVSKI